jgi:hypothetical protein
MFAQFLEEEVLAEVGHWMLTFTIPKILRPYFVHHRKLLGKLCKAAWQTYRELMAEAGKGARPIIIVLSWNQEKTLHAEARERVFRRSDIPRLQQGSAWRADSG